MRTYIAIIDKDKNSAYGIWFPDIPGCFSASDIKEDITKNAMEALSLHLEGMELPIATNGADLTNNAEVSEALKNGAWMYAVPYFTSPYTKPVRANISLDAGMLAAIDAAATERGMTRSNFLVEAARKEIIG